MARSLHRSRRRCRRAPRLASCLSHAGLGSEGVSSGHHEKVGGGGILQPPRAVLVPSDQGLSADTRVRHVEGIGLGGFGTDALQGVAFLGGVEGRVC